MEWVAFLALYGFTGYRFGLDIGLLITFGCWGIYVLVKEIRNVREMARSKEGTVRAG
jgi:hypothetical protein